MFTKLLVPLDGSALAEQALGRAMAIARASKAAVDLVLVHQPFPFNSFGDAPWNAAHAAEGTKYLDTVAAELASGSNVPVTHETLRGDPVEMICRRIDDVKADLVVMTSHGRTGLSRAWLGSVTDSVLRRSATPVLMLRPREGRSRHDSPQGLFKRILVPVDGSDRANEIFATVGPLATCGGARVLLLRVVAPVAAIEPTGDTRFDYVPPIIDHSRTQSALDTARLQLAEVARTLQAESGIEVESNVIVESRIVPAIIDFADEHAADLIAMTTRGRGTSRYLVGSIADKVLRGSHLPMLMLRPLASAQRARTQPAAEEEPVVAAP